MHRPGIAQFRATVTEIARGLEQLDAETETEAVLDGLEELRASLQETSAAVQGLIDELYEKRRGL